MNAVECISSPLSVWSCRCKSLPSCITDLMLHKYVVCFPQPRLLQVAPTRPSAPESSAATAAAAIAAAAEVGDGISSPLSVWSCRC